MILEKGKEISDMFAITETFAEFIDLYKNRFEKRKYFIINEKFEFIKKEPSFILELAYIYYKIKDKKIEDIIKEEFSNTYKEKDKRIDRMSKLEKEKLKESFRRSLVNKDTVHSVKLGNEIFHRNKDEFFEIMYKFSLISADCNKLIKTFFMEILLENMEKSFKNRSWTDEIIRNTVNYFVKSESEFINYSDEKNVQYFVENKVDLLYEVIYIKKYDEIIKKYNIDNMPKIKFKTDNGKYEEMSQSKQYLYSYLKK
ncbi:hypothetical protein EII29_06560 [Leptotrichia sp. OH3620_COT-345]|uniref:hypothetical protein n=1 Tax=Leptotrichia sp. OH3620_COT-345 TaxID=2491048 RepID=UPI000F64FE3C|nr:hypothetical protein [Leptotrichia sp. OH3620_COT-345]RRD39468.1 hypothetical protein EII29_06560 [Leptotrichia sp. OH3620_COT-345]